MATRIIDVSEQGKRVRRAWSDEAKARFVTETLEPRATVRSVARRHGVDASLLYRWRRAFVADRLVRGSSTGDGFVPVQLALPAPEGSPPSLPAGSTEVVSAVGHRVRMIPPVDRATLRLVLDALGR
ncbi:transposase [Novosphingobium chloroacetimidivorans]|uniref:Transposase n=1 Tax=Novosphingobium chloroacetimidivorans TaxID=1428314 RepID=A0A7W7NZA7_9SPHN|nr:transposase [Novosphingobium chloroacetimidivorans]MBB4861095.1 transposase [Novosphingobium chloroacetimidivorans]